MTSLRALLLAFLGGAILNLMPCVFPILAMKAAALAASAHQPREARRDGLLFLAGVLATFLVLAGVLLTLRAGGEAVGWGFQLQSPAVIAGLALLMLAVGLNLSGVFHVGAGLQGAGAGPLSRLPGVNAVRNHTTGEGDRITIRGLSTELNNYTMNGVRIGGTGSPDDSFYRGVRLSFLPPEGIDSITVVKSLTPDRDGDALGGSIDIRTPTAFDHKPTYGVLSASAGLLDKFDDKTSGEVSGSFGRQFNDHWGVFVTASWSRRKSQFEQNGVDGDNQPPVWYEDSESLGWDTDTFVLRGMDLAFGETEVERKGLNASLDYRGDHHDFHFRGQFNEYTQDEFDNRLNFRNDTSKNSTRLTQVDKTATGLANPDDAIIGSGAKGNIYSYTTAQIVDRDGDGVITDADRSSKSYYTLNGASGTWDPQGFRLRRFWEGSRETGSLMSLNLGGVSRYGDFKLDYDLSYAKSEDNIDDSYDMEFRSDKYGWLGNKGVDIVNFGDSRFPKWVLNDAGMAAVMAAVLPSSSCSLKP